MGKKILKNTLLSILNILFVVGIMLQGSVGEELIEKEKALYKAKTVRAIGIRADKDKDSPVIIRAKQDEVIEIFDVDPSWVRIQTMEGKRGYLLREHIYNVEAIDPINTPPYGMVKHQYIATVEKETHVYKDKDIFSDVFVTLQKGARLAIIEIDDGWGKVIYWREYGYIDMRGISELIRVSNTDSPISEQTPIAAFTSYYSVATNDANIGRMLNIGVACEKISIDLEPGEIMDLNKILGPYSPKSGYKPAPILADGTTKLGYGGGTCQVSSTFYNIALQLPGVEVLKRRPHGLSGIRYLPHGVDAAVGNDNINLIIKNNYDFSLRVEASAQDGALFIIIWKGD